MGSIRLVRREQLRKTMRMSTIAPHTIAPIGTEHREPEVWVQGLHGPSRLNNTSYHKHPEPQMVTAKLLIPTINTAHTTLRQECDHQQLRPAQNTITSRIPLHRAIGAAGPDQSTEAPSCT